VIKDDPDNRSTPVSVLFRDDSYSVTVEGDNFTFTEWNIITDKVKEALEAGYVETSGGTVKTAVRTYFGAHNVVIIVEDTTEYTKYKTVKGETAVMYFNFTALKNGTLTGADVADAISSMRSNENWQVKLDARDAVRMAKFDVNSAWHQI
jgi:hypothetical protein